MLPASTLGALQCTARTCPVLHNPCNNPSRVVAAGACVACARTCLCVSGSTYLPYFKAGTRTRTYSCTHSRASTSSGRTHADRQSQLQSSEENPEQAPRDLNPDRRRAPHFDSSALDHRARCGGARACTAMASARPSAGAGAGTTPRCGCGCRKVLELCCAQAGSRCSRSRGQSQSRSRCVALPPPPRRGTASPQPCRSPWLPAPAASLRPAGPASRLPSSERRATQNALRVATTPTGSVALFQ